RGALLRSPRLRGRRHLWAMRKIDEGRRDHQPAAARRRDGFRALARQAFDRTLTERHPAAAEGAVGFHAQHRQVVRERLLSHMGAKLRRPSPPVLWRLPLPCRTAQTPLYVARALSALRLAV